MIFSENGFVKLKGDSIEVIADATCILRVVYQTLFDEYGKEMANETLVDIGRRAVMSDEEIEEELNKRIIDKAGRLER